MIENEIFDKDELSEDSENPTCDPYNLDSCFKTLDNSTFASILKEMNEIYKKKNHDYGNSFIDSCNEFGLISPVIRMSDKLNRLKVLIEEPREVDTESISDTLLDLANYAVMTLAWIKDNDKSV